jgi:Reverse transcriptase (RNA-dependent DNA polymerase)
MPKMLYSQVKMNLVAQFGVEHQQYADDTQLYVSLSKTDLNISVTNLHSCLAVLHHWFSQNGLVINPDKSEAVLFSTAQRARTSPLAQDEADVAGCPVELADSAKILGSFAG